MKIKNLKEIVNTIICGDALEVTSEIPENSIDLIATDSPYGISFMSKDWDKFNEVVNPQGAYEKEKGFKKLPRQNTQSMREFFVPVWKECLRTLKPGAFAFVMCSPRADVMAKQIVCLQEAGFNIGFTPIFWTYASGFPKAQNVSKFVDKKGRINLFFNEIRRFLIRYLKKSGLSIKQVNENFGFSTSGSGMAGHWFANITQQNLPTKKQYSELKRLLKIPDNKFDDLYREIEEDKRPVIGESSNWGRKSDSLGIGGNSWKITLPYSPKAKELDGSYGGFQPKPAVEVIIVAMKPLSEKTYADQALNNKKGITWFDDCRIPYENDDDKESSRYGSQADIRGGNLKSPIGIKDKNVLSSEQGRFPANLLVSDDVLNDGKERRAGDYKGEGSKSGGIWQKSTGEPAGREYGDSGSFSRYFDLDKWAKKTFPFLVVPKASRSEKTNGLENMPEKKVRGDYKDSSQLGLLEKIQNSPRPTCKNFHPTVKPIKLMAYLVTLGSRAKDIVLDPFVGSGTTALACEKLDRQFIGIDNNKEYCQIAQARIKALKKQGKLF